MTDIGSVPEATSALEDDRLQFFLENRDLIRTWAALEVEVSAAVDEELRRLGEDVQAAAASAGIELAVAERVAGRSFVAPMLYGAGWRSPDGDGPNVAVGIGWDGKVFPTGGWPGISLPYVGLLASHTTERGRQIETALRPIAVRELVETRLYKKGSDWIAYRFIPAKDDWYLDIGAWRTWVVQELLRAWRDCAPTVDRAIASLSTGIPIA
jgi:hypothetical protein